MEKRSPDADRPDTRTHGHSRENEGLGQSRKLRAVGELPGANRRGLHDEHRTWDSHRRNRTEQDVRSRQGHLVRPRDDAPVQAPSCAEVTPERQLNLEDRPRQSGRSQSGGRVLRNRRYRRPFDDHRETKRLFTPEIKKFLKDWLVRRREHPYPNRDEKKRLALQTGLTYIQICNWFANWRRKLKNAGQEKRTTWGNLIKNYNTQAQGNVEQFSISSDDSIWEQQALLEPAHEKEEPAPPKLTFAANATAMDHSYSVIQDKGVEPGCPDDSQPQCFQVTSTTTEEEDAHTAQQTVQLPCEVTEDLVTTPAESVPSTSTSYTGTGLVLEEEDSDAVRRGPTSTNKYKSHIMEKYLRDLRLEPSQSDDVELLQKKKTRPNDGNGDIANPDRGKEAVPHSSTNTMDKNVACTEDKISWLEKKSKIMKKAKESCPPLVLSKWLESAAKFQPTNCYVPWSVSKSDAWHPSCSRSSSKKIQKLDATYVESAPSKMEVTHWGSKGHHREELDAAEALTRLSGLQH